MHRASKFCPNCKRRFPLTESRCNVCRTTDLWRTWRTMPLELWTVTMQPGGRGWQHHPPNSLNDETIRRLSRGQGGDGGDAA
jgi:hypothetical protein